MSLASLPHGIPFNLGGLVYPAETKAYGFTGILPKGLPFTLSALSAYESISYGTVGWELICRSGLDFQTELLRTRDMNSLTFSKELSAFGAASFSLNLDHNLFRQALNDGSSIDTLFDYENLWEIRFDNMPVFQILGTAVTDTQVNESEVRTATVSGSGIGKVLEWAQIFPEGFPNKIVTKLETLKIAVDGETLDRAVWSHTPLSPNISTTSQHGYTEEQTIYDQLTQEREGLESDLSSANNSYDDAKSDFNDVMKQKTSTAAQKLAAKKALAKAEAAVATILKNLLVNNTRKSIAAAQRRNFYGLPEDDETYTFLKIRLQSAGTAYATSGTFDLESSGISGRVLPAPVSFDAQGQTHTVFKIMHDPGYFEDYYIDYRNYARMYTSKIDGQLKLVAEVSNDNEVTIEEWAYSLDAQRYWRIREDNGALRFDTSPDGITWTNRMSCAFSWPTMNVVFQFGMEFGSASGIASPLCAYLYDLNGTTIPSTETTMQLFRKYLTDAQGRGVITQVNTDFTDSLDSRGLAWSGLLATDIPEGTKLSDALVSLTQLQQADWIMDVDFTLRAFQRTKGDEAIPPVYFLKEDVVFNEGGAQVSKERTRNRDGIANAIVGKNASGQYAYIEDGTSISKYQRREAFISAGTATDLVDLATVLDSSLEELKEEKTSWKVVVAANQPGRRVFQDYDVGDWIAIQNSDSNNTSTTGLWRVVGIAVNVASDASETVELTLQSRKELLVERLKQQVANLSASSASGGTTLGSAISAATLIEQATLAGLRDVVADNPVEGDVLTYSKGFWVPIAPGDKTIPNVPEIISAYSNIYYPEDGYSVRAQAEVTWAQPTNTDGSFITDGHHYEIRYRPDASADYPATWFEAAQMPTYEDLYTWGQPTIPPILNGGWQTIYIGWDDLSTVIQELTPGIKYILQIRAVDSSTPQHFSEWSEDYSIEIANDTIAPPKPAPPVVASSYLAIQVTHYLGKAEGGTFNLPPDMAYIEVHAGPPAFYPDETTRLGKIIADNGLIRSGTPVIQTFNIDSTENIYVRVIAVDRTGNRSAPSNAVTATINLIDDAHISDLTASKITAGTISSSIILSGVIKTAESGARAEMNFEGFRIFDEDNDATVSLLGNPSTNGNFLLIKDLEDPTLTLAGIDGLGRGSFQSVSVANSISIGGADLITEILDPLPKGVIAYGVLDTSIVGAGVNIERGLMEISFIAVESRSYRISLVTEWESTVDNSRLLLRLRDYGTNDPFIGIGDGGWFQQSISPAGITASGNAAAQITYIGTFTPGLHRILVTFAGITGIATVNAPGASGIESVTVLWVEDVGLPQTDIAVINDAKVPEYQQPSNPTTPAPKPKVTYTKTYAATWSGTYRSNGDLSSSHGNTMVQGDSGADDWLNDARSLCGFNYKQIMADTAGSTIKECYITLYASHWYWNDGGTARIGTHNYTSKPSSWADSRVGQQRVTSSDWPKPGKRKVSLGTTIGNEFKSGASKGIALGPTNGTKTQYGKFNGNGQSSEPVLTIVYVK